MRASELCGLKWEDLTVVKLDGRECGVVSLNGAKRGGERTNILPPRVWQAVKDYQEWFEKEEGRIARAASGVPIFHSQRGEGFTRRGLHHLLTRLGERAGVEIHAHKCRRGFASYWMNQSKGQALDTMMEVGGWKDLATVKRHYGYYFDDTLLKAHRQFGPLWDDWDWDRDE